MAESDPRNSLYVDTIGVVNKEDGASPYRLGRYGEDLIPRQSHPGELGRNGDVTSSAESQQFPSSVDNVALIIAASNEPSAISPTTSNKPPPYTHNPNPSLNPPQPASLPRRITRRSSNGRIKSEREEKQQREQPRQGQQRQQDQHEQPQQLELLQRSQSVQPPQVPSSPPPPSGRTRFYANLPKSPEPTRHSTYIPFYPNIPSFPIQERRDPALFSQSTLNLFPSSSNAPGRSATTSFENASQNPGGRRKLTKRRKEERDGLPIPDGRRNSTAIFGSLAKIFGKRKDT
ncbi:predicted protein [Uncinocarpus reesii 1704]|uniref:Uncharacterized protein n=1 Tax=Uncinocarpus reesii (strain UAMH 1704) TaxID=336963 RepID=C4JYG1_UNCRE|nr:uncharacterized protein UREG_07212 [Uncinocarpus reesii 1704]EEP82347.1 predicted protein [Uncinocarpus reesii 1704]